jgi:hypothetical protein
MKNTIKIEAIQRIAGVIVLVAVIGFSMAGCLSLGVGSSGASSGNPSSSSGASSGSPSNSSGGTAGKDTWPADDVWASYYLSGLQQPSGTNVTIINMYGTYTVMLDNADKAAFDNLVGQVEKMSNWKVQERKADAVAFVNAGKAGLVIAFDSKEKKVTIVPNKL